MSVTGPAPDPAGPRGSRAQVLIDGARLAVGLLTVFPVRPPRTVDRTRAGVAMGAAPLVGLLLGLACAGVLKASYARWDDPLLAAVLTVGASAVLTGGLHLDGLADVGDGLGSRLPPREALDVMRAPEVGALGVSGLVLVLLVQVAALAAAADRGTGVLAVVVACVAARAVLPLACGTAGPAARSDGLGALVAGSVPAPVAVLGWVAVVVVAARWGPAAAAAVVAAGLAGMALVLWCVRRLGGVTGDVLGAAVEVSTAAALLVLAAPA